MPDTSMIDTPDYTDTESNPTRDPSVAVSYTHLTLPTNREV